MAGPYQVNLTVRNNVDWTASFTLYNGLGATPPWSGVAAWAAGQTYQTSPASCVTYLGDLYVASPAAGGSWAAASSWAADAANWTKIGDAATYAATPYDLTGSVQKMTLVKLDANGAIVSPQQKVVTLTSDGSDGNPVSLVQSSPTTNGVVTMNLSFTLGRVVAAGVYGYDMVSIKAGAREVVMFGTVTVVQGATT